LYDGTRLVIYARSREVDSDDVKKTTINAYRAIFGRFIPWDFVKKFAHW